MVDYNTVAEYKCALHTGSFVMDWNKDLNMEWSTKELQIAATVDPRHKHLKRDEIRDKAKKYLNGLGLVRRKVASPGEIHDKLVTELDPSTLPSAHGGHIITSFNSVEETSGPFCGD